MSYTDMTAAFNFKDLLTYQNLTKLSNNDAFLLTMLSGYRRPVLTFINVTTVDVEANTGTANQTTIVFPDGTVLSVTEDTSSSNKYRRFDITATANFTSGTEDSGIRSGISEATNTWYAIYAVKSQINSANFVLAGDTTLPLQANFATLNTRYGTNGWLYLGMIRNGDNSGATGDILDFKQQGNRIEFKNTAASSGSGFNSAGIRLADTGGATTLTYTYSAGTGTAQIPDHITAVIYGVSFVAIDISVYIQDSAAAHYYSVGQAESGYVDRIEMAASEGIKISNSTASSRAASIWLGAIIDPILGVGGNPQL